MFEIGFQELLLIFVIALVVLGPERLPKLVGQVGRWAGKAKAMARQFREQLESEINLEELNKASKTQPKPEAAQPWNDSPAAEAPVPDPSAPDTPYVPPADDFAHHATTDYPYTPAAAEDTPAAPEPEHATAETPVVSTHERL